MEKLDLSRLKLASSSLGDRIKTSGSQMGRTISSKMKEILQTPTPESKIVDESTSDHMEEANWGLNLRICAMISREEYDGAEIVRSIKKKLLPGKNPLSQCLSLDLLEACASNCEKVFSAVASEKVLEDMVKLIEYSRTEHGVRVRPVQLIRAWAENGDLEYLPVFHQTYMHLKSKEIPLAAQVGTFPRVQYNVESYLGQRQVSAPEGYPVPNTASESENTTFVGYDFQYVGEKKEFLVVDELTISMLDKCKQSLPVVQSIVETTSEDEVMLFDALNLHDELQLIISIYDELVAALAPEQPKNHPTDEVSRSSNSTEAPKPLPAGGNSMIPIAVDSELSSTVSSNPGYQE